MSDVTYEREAAIVVTSHGDDVNFFEPIAAYCSSSIFCEINL